MAADASEVEILRSDLSGLRGLTEKAMFGGTCFFQHGHMIGGIRSAKNGGGIFRVGKANEPAALALDGVAPMDFTGRKMGGFVMVDSDTLGDDVIRTKLLDMALAFTASLPPK